MFRLVYSGEGATQPLVDDFSLTKDQKWQLLFDRNWRNLAPSSQTKWLVYLRKWKTVPPAVARIRMALAKAATAEARQCEEADPSCSASTLSNEEYASLLDAAMRFPDKQVGLCVAAMVSCGLAAGFRSDDLQDTRYFMELICSVPAEPLPMQMLALANNAGKANQDAQMTYAALANHRQPHLDCLAYLSQLVLHQTNVTSTMPDGLVKTKVMHLMRCSGTVSVAAAACSMDVLRVWGRWARQTSVASTALSPSSTWLKLFGRAAPLCCKVLHPVNLSNR
ncbi:hypothetical protein WJX77_005986 [Trebouxia sp. C0004]